MDRVEEPAAEVWVHPSLEVRPSPIAGAGLFATTGLEPDVVVIRLGGRLVNSEELHRLFDAAGENEYIDTIAVGDDTHLVLPPGTMAHFGNHSCDPTMWPVGVYELATRRPIQPGDELTIDYGVISDDPSFRMNCTCGAASCRGVVTGEDCTLALGVAGRPGDVATVGRGARRLAVMVVIELDGG